MFGKVSFVSLSKYRCERS